MPRSVKSLNEEAAQLLEFFVGRLINVYHERPLLDYFYKTQEVIGQLRAADRADTQKADPYAGLECPNCGDEMVRDEHIGILRCPDNSTCHCWATPVDLRAIRKDQRYESCMAGCGRVRPIVGDDVCSSCGVVCSDSPATFDDWNHPGRVREREGS